MSAAPPVPWLVLDSGPCDAAFNMALDEALLELAPQVRRPVLRFYGWTQPAASFGYFQRVADIERATSLRPLVRRPTGGGLVPHAADWTYSVVIPSNHEWYKLRAVESYERMHQWIRTTFASLGVPTELAPCSRMEISGLCFAGYERSDVLRLGRKIAGAAQRRAKSGLLIQGSVQPPPAGIARKVWQDAMLHSTGGTSSVVPMIAIPQLVPRADQLAREKFSSDAHNRRR